MDEVMEVENTKGMLDELIIDAKKVPLIEDNKERFEQCYRVQLQYGLKATDNVTPKQWIIIEGQPEDRVYARNYIRALCNAEEKLCIQYPVELHSILSNPKIHTRLERQSKTAITFDPGRVGEALISGMDTLAVTLAFSAVEDIISKYSEDGNGDAILESPIAKLASSRLDSELQRLHSQDKEILYDDDYSKMPDAVKRSILNWYLEDDSDTSTSNHGPVNSDTAGNIVNDVSAQFQNAQITSGYARKKTPSESDTADTVGYLAKPSDFVASTSSETSLPPVSLPQESSLLRDTGRRHGYTDAEIDNVLAAALGPMRTSEFIKALVANRKMDKKSSGVSARPVDSKQIGTTENMGSSLLVADTIEKHPMDDFLASGSPTTKSKQPHSQSPLFGSESGNQQSFVDYFAKLSQDFQEEGGEIALDELKRRSRERQKLLRDALMKQNAESEEEAVEAAGSEEEDEDTAENENPDNPDGWVKAGAKPKKHRRNKKKRNQSPLLNSVQLDRSKNQSEQNYTYSNSPTKFQGFKQPNSPKKRTTDQNQHRFPSNSPQRKQTFGTQRYNNENKSPSPTKEWKERQSPRDPKQNQGSSAFPDQQHTSRQQDLNAVRKQHTKLPTKMYPENPGQQPVGVFGAALAQQPVSIYNQQQQQQQQQHFTGAVPMQSLPTPATKGRKNLRYIIIDGSNIAMSHGNGQKFSCRGIQLCVNYFLQRGHTQITAFVPQWRSRSDLAPGYEVYDQPLLEALREQGFLVYTPARRVPGKNIVCYDDRFVIRLAKETDGIIVSNDNYRDLWHQHRDWRTIIEERLLMFSFVGDIFMPPDDPLGRDGPNLDQFLQKSDLLGSFQGTSTQMRQQTQQNPRNNGQARFIDRNQQVAQNAWNRGPPPQNRQPNYVPHGYRPYDPHQNYTPRPMQYRQQQPIAPFKTVNTESQQRMQQPTQLSGASKPINSKPVRTTEITGWLQSNLEKIFPDDADKISRILENHPFETDLNKLSSYILEIL